MRLINVDTLELEHFGSNVPKYAILSHTWGSEEVTLQEWIAVSTSCNPVDELSAEFAQFLSHRNVMGISPLSRIKRKSGYTKIMMCCEQAARYGLRYVWVDTCCIDKTSSAELSEAINSMFQWYQSSEVCYAFLSDVQTSALSSQDERDSAIRTSRWFTRGWTLQELLAPREMLFFDAQWKLISPKTELVQLLSSITGIASNFIDGTEDIYNASVAQRMSWAAKRQTTRQEDIAYCLLGIFEVNIPLLYGEGEKAFFRLHEEIVRRTEDHTYMAWGYQMPLERVYHGIFARSPIEFTGCQNVVHDSRQCAAGAVQLTNKGLQMRLSFLVDRYGYTDYSVAYLGCCRHGNLSLALPVDHEETIEDGANVWRVPGGTPVGMPYDPARKGATVFLKMVSSATHWKIQSSQLAVEIRNLRSEESAAHLQLVEVLPSRIWMPSRVLGQVAVLTISPSKRILMKLAPSIRSGSDTDYLIVTLDIKWSSADDRDENEHEVSRIRSKVLRGDEILDNGKPYISLIHMCSTTRGARLRYDSLSDFGNEAELCGRLVSVDVTGGESWIVSINVAPSGAVTEDE
jgi:hypothetical protein